MLSVKDPEVLGISNEAQIAKVKTEKYFTVIDEKGFLLAAGKDCNIRKFKQVFNSYVTGIGMRKNSAFVTMVGEE